MDFIIRYDLPIAGVIISSTMLRIETIENSSYGWLKIQLLQLFGEIFKDFVVNNLDSPTAATKNLHIIKKNLDDRITVPFIGVLIPISYVL